jgi:hypothetical protein
MRPMMPKFATSASTSVSVVNASALNDAKAVPANRYVGTAAGFGDI